jgi:hypothetical protein
MIRPHALFLFATIATHALAAAPKGQPGRPAGKGCVWEKRSDSSIGLGVWVQRCDYGFRKIDFVFEKSSLAMRYSDGGAPEPVVDVLDLQPGETPETGIKRVFASHTSKDVAGHCVLTAYKGVKPQAGVDRFTFVPDAAFQKELDAKADPGDIPEPGCGEWGDAPDGIQYFEVHPSSKARRILFVRVGQDEPLFDERTLELR